MCRQHTRVRQAYGAQRCLSARTFLSLDVLCGPLCCATYDLCGPCQFRSQGQFLLPNQMERVCSEGLVMVAIFILVSPQREPPAIFAMPRNLLAGQVQSIYERSTLAQHISVAPCAPGRCSFKSCRRQPQGVNKYHITMILSAISSVLNPSDGPAATLQTLPRQQ